MKGHLAALGGLERDTLCLADAFVRRGHRVRILTTGSCEGIQSEAELCSVASTLSLSYLHIRHFDARCQEWLRAHPSPIVFGMERNRYQTHYRAGSGVHAAFLQQRALYDPLWKRISFSLNPLHRTILRKEREAFEHPGLERLFAISHQVAREICLHYPRAESKIEVVHNGVEWGRYEESFRASERGVRGGRYELLFVGNGYKRKGLERLLQALSLLDSKEVHLSVVGKERHLGWYREWVEREGLGAQVTFWGSQRDLTAFYARADAVVLPSFYEPFGNVILEGLAMGCVACVSPFAGVSEVITSDMGIVLEGVEPHAIAVALRQLLARPRGGRAERRAAVRPLDYASSLSQMVEATVT